MPESTASPARGSSRASSTPRRSSSSFPRATCWRSRGASMPRPSTCPTWSSAITAPAARSTPSSIATTSTIPALVALAEIVRGADTDHRDLTPESAGLYAAATGFQAISRDDHDNMARQFPLYDALYDFCRARAGAPVDEAGAVRLSPRGREERRRRGALPVARGRAGPTAWPPSRRGPCPIRS